MLLNSNDIGELIDNMKIFKQKFVEKENVYYIEWKIKKETDKYNL